ncbi:17043_t:CDS:1, partial [Dentiscutata erythropus]
MPYNFLMLYQHIKRLEDEGTIELIRPKNQSDGPNNRKSRLRGNKLIILCSLEDYRCENSVVTMLLNE